MDSHHQQAWRLRLRTQRASTRSSADRSDAYRSLDAAILEAALPARGASASARRTSPPSADIGYTPSVEEAIRKLDAGEYQAAFFLRPTPVEQVRAVAAAGETMPPKSTYFFPKLLTGIAFNPLS